MNHNSSVTFSDEFLFGIANAPGHVEDELDDSWMELGREGGIRAFLNQVAPEERLQFWTKPELEIDLAHELGVQIFRLGIDWERIHKGPDKFDQEAIARYRRILESIHKKGMRVMLTLFHFTVPKWIQETGGWVNPETKSHFSDFSKKVIGDLEAEVDFWVTFNEPQIFSIMTHQLGVFPPGKRGNFLQVLTSLNEMVSAHKDIYNWAHGLFPSIKIGIAQHMGHHTGDGLSKLVSVFTGHFMNWYFPEKVRSHLDYFGFNYYGAEWIKGSGIDIREGEEYSEAGRAVHPAGLFLIGQEIHRRFPNLPLFITENGISDETDWLRPSYLIEHLKVISALQEERIKVLGYIHWTLTDNMEWADGYGPKFGLVGVDRGNGFERMKRPSFYLYQKIIQSRSITWEMQDKAWRHLQEKVGALRPLWRHEDGRTALDAPRMRPVQAKDWRV